MTVRVWFEEDVENAIRAAYLSADLLPRGEYRKGYYKALAILATSFGLRLPDSSSPVIEIEAPNSIEGGVYDQKETG